MIKLITALTLGVILITNTDSVKAIDFRRAIDSSTQVSDQSRIHYAYGPSITYDDGAYHMIYCSNGHEDGYPKSWDYLRYTSSTDAESWQAPSILVRGAATNNQTDLAACIGSLVYYKYHYYLFYESAQRIPGTVVDPSNPTFGTQSVIQVARANDISGPYYTYNKRGNWDEIDPPDAQPIITPLNPSKGGPTHLGAGKPSVIVHNNTLHIWYTDDTIHPHGLYHLASTDPSSWNPSREAITNVYDGNSSTVKYDPLGNRFVMLYIDDYLRQYPSLFSRVSADGATWSASQPIITAPNLPSYSHSPGLVADKSGHLLAGKSLLGFGSCPILFQSSYCDPIDLYDLYLTDLDPANFARDYSYTLATTPIKNADFETGIVSNWHKDNSQPAFTPSITTGRSGQYGLALAGQTGVVYQDVSGLKANTNYHLSVWARANSGNTSTIHFWLYDLAAGTTISESAGLTPNESWQQLVTTLKTPETGQLRLHLSYLQGNNQVIVDDIAIVEANIPGDLNTDGKVDIFDYQKLITNFGNPYTIFDYQKIISNFGK